MRHSKFIMAAAVTAWTGLASLLACDDGAESDHGVQTGDLRPRPGAEPAEDSTPTASETSVACPAPGAQCRSDADCPVTLICRLCPDGSCADPNVHCVNGQCSAPSYTCGGAPSDPEPQCKTDADCPVLGLCRLCPDGSCADPNVHCTDGACTPPSYTCPPTPSTTPCRSTQECAGGEYCTVEDGVCDRAPGCGPGVGCVAVCYGTCAKRAACDSVEQRLEAFVGANKACATTDDCQVLYAGCGLSFEDGCTGGVYVNQSIDTATFNALSSALTECKGSSCAACERLTLPAACIAGICQKLRL